MLKIILTALLCVAALPLAHAGDITLAGVKQNSCSYRTVTISGTTGNITAACLNDAPPVTDPSFSITCHYKKVTIGAMVNVAAGGPIAMTCFTPGEPDPSHPTTSFGGLDAQTITFNSYTHGLSVPATMAVGTSATVHSSSGLPLQLSSASPAVCKVSGTQVWAIAEGTCYITANQPGSEAFFAAPQVVQTITVTEAP